MQNGRPKYNWDARLSAYARFAATKAEPLRLATLADHKSGGDQRHTGGTARGDGQQGAVTRLGQTGAGLARLLARLLLGDLRLGLLRGLRAGHREA